MLSRASSATFSRKRVVEGRVGRAAELEIQPDANAPLVADIEQGVVLVVSSAPESQRVHVGRHGVVDVAAKDVLSQAVGEAIGRDPIGPFGKERNAVDLEMQRRGRCLRHGAKRPQTDPLRRTVEADACPPLAGDRPGPDREAGCPCRPATKAADDRWPARCSPCPVSDRRVAEATGCSPRKTLTSVLRPIACRRAGGYLNIERDLAFLGMVLLNGNVIQPGHVERFDPDFPPDSAGDQGRPPVPAEIARLLPHVARPRDKPR